MGLGCRGSSGNALLGDGILSAQSCQPSSLLLALGCAHLFLPSFTRDLPCVLAEAPRDL